MKANQSDKAKAGSKKALNPKQSAAVVAEKHTEKTDAEAVIKKADKPYNYIFEVDKQLMQDFMHICKSKKTPRGKPSWSAKAELTKFVTKIVAQDKAKQAAALVATQDADK